MSETIAFKPETLQQVHKIIARYPEGRQKSALIPVLHLAQKEFGGWLDVPVMDYVAGLLDILPIEVYEVATFYTMFNMKPVGKYVLEVCCTGPCMLNGSEKIVEHIKKTLNIKNGETTPDGLFTLKTAECLGACGYAPMMQLGKFYHEHLTIEKVDEILELCRQGTLALD
ncbi:NAD(P)H-dependent oxidoreductase subunit E [Elizabethkingia sp. JS20170427COW]|uniref:NADH-quinone oxidoreductase subunit NuoE family protein n=1 Tax=Elizabethkingia sp. JS20170427COW TaxID=2583851 RepID=UPI0011108332|nr:NAD(P)H-dependent oxidoreductase subunit E [Elizabethkingia sp. JS20170427COW]QCX52634.1 NAD(P)H-dependent oxidoreductase subunit E [Elizabethkingia sp. JS20170427COW]